MGDRVLYYKDKLILKYLGVSTESSRYPEFSLTDFTQTNRYFSFLSNVYSEISPKKEAIINNAKIGGTLGFVSENVKSQKDLINRFPYGLLSIRSLVLDLKSKNILAPYGNYNNNYLSKDGEILYSDDLELSYLTNQVLNNLSQQEIKQPDVFMKKLATEMRKQWLEMKKSGDYGEDGLYHGKRGYSKNTLLMFSELSPDAIANSHWKNKWPNKVGNDSIVRSWIIGINRNVTDEEDAFKLAQAQSYINNSDADMAIACGAIAATFNKFVNKDKPSKKEIVQYLMDELKKHKGEKSLALEAVKLGIKLNDSFVSPILVYSSISGFAYNELLTNIIYSFLHFKNFESALVKIIHTTGDNDSLSFLLGPLFALHDNISLSPKYLKHLEAKNLDFSK